MPSNKPWGLTPYGARALRRETDGISGQEKLPAALKIMLIGGAILGALVVLHHLFGQGGR